MKNTIIFDNKANFKQEETLTFFLNENLDFKEESKIFSAQIFNKIKVFLKNLKSKKKGEKIISFDISEKNRILFIILKEKLLPNDFEKIGANFFSYTKINKISKIIFFSDTLKLFKSYQKNTELILNFVHGFNLKSYFFDKYKTRNKNDYYFSLKIISSKKSLLNKNYFKYKAIESGVFQTRDLVSEPPNILYPKKYVETIKKLSSLGLKIQVYNETMKNIIIEGNEGYQKAKNFMKQIMPKSVKYVKKYRGKVSLFYKEGIEKKLNQIFEPIVKLKSGGYIVINPTEALVSIDINSGRSTKEINVERTALATNLEAADEIARQIKVRDLAGLIIVDFIDMFNFNNRRAVEKRLRDNFKNDRARIQLERISNFGLLEMSRQRLRESSVQWDIVLTLDSFAFKILKLAEEQALANKIKNLNIKVAEKVSKTIKEQFDDELSYCKKKYKLQINFINDNSLIIPEYKIELLNKNKKIIKSIEHVIKARENLNHNKFYPNNNQKFLKKNLEQGKIQLFKKHKNKKHYKKNFYNKSQVGIKI